METVLLSTHNICFGWEIKQIVIQYALLSGGLRDCTVVTLTGKDKNKNPNDRTLSSKQTQDQAHEKLISENIDDGFDHIVRKLRSCKTKVQLCSSTAQKIAVNSKCLEMYESDGKSMSKTNEDTCKRSRKMNCDEETVNDDELQVPKSRTIDERSSLEVIGTALKIFIDDVEKLENGDHHKRYLRSSAVKVKLLNRNDRNEIESQEDKKEAQHAFVENQNSGASRMLRNSARAHREDSRNATDSTDRKLRNFSCKNRSLETLGEVKGSELSDKVPNGTTSVYSHNISRNLPAITSSADVNKSVGRLLAENITVIGNDLGASEKASEKLSYIRHSPRQVNAGETLQHGSESFKCSKSRSCKNSKNLRSGIIPIETSVHVPSVRKCNLAIGSHRAHKTTATRVNKGKKPLDLNNSCGNTGLAKKNVCRKILKYKSAKTFQICRKSKKRLGYWDVRLEKILNHLRAQVYHRTIGIC